MSLSIASALRWFRPFETGGKPKESWNIDRACSDCRFHSEASAGPTWDRCHNPKARPWDPIRGKNSNPECIYVRQRGGTCGPLATHFEPKQ